VLFTAVDSLSKLGEVPREEAARLRREWLVPVAEATRPPKRVTRERVRGYCDRPEFRGTRSQLPRQRGAGRVAVGTVALLSSIQR